MFRITDIYDKFTSHLLSPWWMYLLIGLNLVALALLIFIFPDLLAYLIAAFLLLNGTLFIFLGVRIKRLKPKYDRWNDNFWVETE